jgi:hypothetical protein
MTRLALVLCLLPATALTVSSQERAGAAPVAARPSATVPLPAVSGEVTGPGPMFESLMTLAPGDDMARFEYQAREYLVSGMASGEPYVSRIVVRRPRTARFSGLVLAESMHPSGNAWMFHFTHRYSMSSGHIGVEILTSSATPLVEFNRARYGTLRTAPSQASEILAQVGALIKSNRPANPLAGLRVRQAILAGTSASAAVVINYLPTHLARRLADDRPVYDGFLPTSTGADAPLVDVPIVEVPTMTELTRGRVTERPDSDTRGSQFRLYEFAGMAHIDTRDAAAYYPNPCKLPISRFPLAAYMSVALDHLWKWIDKGTLPPRADRIAMDRDAANDGSLMALDESGNPRGGIRSPYVDLPVAKYGVPNAGASPPVANAHPFVSSRSPAAQDQLCQLAGYEMALSADDLRKRYGSTKAYRDRVARRVDELTKQGWSLPVYRDVILADAAAVAFEPKP